VNVPTRPVIAIAQAAHAVGLARGWRRFRRAARDPKAAQRARVEAILRANVDTAYGREHGFGVVLERGYDLVLAFQDSVPVVAPSDVAPWLSRAVAGERNVLTTAGIERFEPTSGSTDARRLIPFTADLRAEFSAATDPWLFDMMRRHRGLWGRPSYWSLSPVARATETTPGGTPIGAEDDTAYFHPLARWAIRQTLAVDAGVARAPSMLQWRMETISQLLNTPDLGFISVWSPTFILRLLDHIEDDFTAIVSTLPDAIAAPLSDRVQRVGHVTGHALWPDLALLSCWTHGASAAFVDALRHRFPRTPIQPKGLLATEGVVSFPLGDDDAPVLAINGHFLEFEPLDAPSERPAQAHELVPGARYEVLLTTAGGLYRYRLGDVVEVAHTRFENAPRVRFVGRRAGVSDLCGEKLHPIAVSDAIDAAVAETGLDVAFILVAPDGGTADRYRMFVESNSDDTTLNAAAEALEARLCRLFHYGYCRDLGQLQPLVAERVNDGWALFQARLEAEGMTAGDIKPRRLDRRPDWQITFAQTGRPT